VLLPGPGAILFLVGLVVVVVAGWAMDRTRSTGEEQGTQPLWRTLGSESFAILSAGCFMVLSWQYNAQMLTRGVMIAAGSALLVQAALPARNGTGAGGQVRREG
jgi:uncharacterized membrane protein YdcZ (DUF606 family)